MGEYGREQRNQLSRAIANSKAGTRQLKEFVDSRPFRILQPNTSYDPFSKMLIQKKAYNNNLSIKYAPCFKKAIIIDNPTEQEKTVIDDPYSRYYESENEFRKHVGGEPVPCGLIKNISKWYRLPFPPASDAHFFVLGEAHDIVNYRTILEESNQNGKALGEVGVMPIDEMRLDTKIFDQLLFDQIQSEKSNFDEIQSDTISAEHNPTAVREWEQIENMTYFPMESILSKTLFALLDLAGKYKQGKSKFTLEELGVVPKNVIEQQDRKTAGNAPFGAYDYKPYVMDDVAQRVCNDCKTEIVHYLKTAREESFTQQIKKLMELLNGVPKDKSEFDWVPLIDQCKICADKELERAQINSTRRPYDTLLEEQKLYESDENSYHANGNRETFMFLRILEVCQDKSYLMAGMGNEHASHLQEPLKRANIPVITLDEFMQPPYTQSAK